MKIKRGNTIAVTMTMPHDTKAALYAIDTAGIVHNFTDSGIMAGRYHKYQYKTSDNSASGKWKIVAEITKNNRMMRRTHELTVI